MRYCILGPLEVRDHEVDVPLGSPRARTVLALLLVHRNHLVTGERLVDELYDGAPPATATKALQNAVSQLRRALPAEVLHTVGRSYRLDVPPGDVDADRFEAALDAALDEPDAAEAAQALRDALALWRGPPLPELAGHDAARPEIGRLEDRRATAFEERVEADLALGRHADLVAELEAEVAAQPLRERLRAQLVLALYRSGRQAEALEAFQDARRTLVGELGLEPGPALRDLHAAVLRQDPALDPPARPPRHPVQEAGRGAARPPPGRRVPGGLLLAGGALLAAVVAVGALLSGSGDQRRAAGIRVVPGDSLVTLDARTGRVRAVVPAGGTPTAVAVAAGASWALNADDRTLTRADRSSGAARTLALPDLPMSVGAGPAGLFVAVGRPGPFQGHTEAQRLLALDPRSGVAERELALPRRMGSSPYIEQPLAVGERNVWIAGGHLYRLDAASGGPARRVAGVIPFGVAADGDAAWVIAAGRDSDVLARVSPTGRVVTRVPIPASRLAALAVGAGAVWVTAPGEGLLWRVTEQGARSIEVGAGALGVTAASSGVWVANTVQGTVTKVDPRRNRVVAVVRLGNAPRSVTVDGDRVWVTVASAGGPPARDAGRGVAGAVRSKTCSAVVAGAGPPDRLIVSDLPLHQRGGIAELPDVITYVLRRRGFRAGRFRVGYQSCDDSTAVVGGFDLEKCRSNAGLYAAAPKVVGIVGPFHSDCAMEQLSITNRAPGGPLATISPTNTLLALTKAVPGGTPGLIDRLYPTGRRHYARLWGSDDAQAAALVQVAADRGRRRLAIVDGGLDYGHGLAWHGRRAARRLGLHVVGPRTFDAGAGRGHVRAIAAAVTRSRPDAVVFAGVPFARALQFVARLRDRGLEVLLPDAWLAGPQVFAAIGSRAEGLLATSPGVPLQRSGPAARRFAEAFRATQPGGRMTLEGLYTAQATEVLLDAIARSDGSRPSVSRALLSTRIEDGLVGPVRFDAAGDVTPSPFSVVRLSPSARTVNGIEPDGSNIVDVVAPD